MRCKYHANNCSIVRIIDNEVDYLGTRLFYTLPTEIKFPSGSVSFFQRYKNTEYSLNQSDDARDLRTIRLPINTAIEVTNAFKEIEKENERRIQTIMQ
jgi:hypothetical protein